MSMATLLLAALATATETPAAAAPAAATPTAPQTAQQQFDAASEAFDAHRCPEAIERYDALAARPGLARNTRIQAVIHVRKGACLVRLDRLEEAAGELAAALPGLAATDPDTRPELATAHQSLGLIAYRAFDFANATHEFEQAHALSTGSQAYESLLWLARSTMFEPEPVSVGYAQEALRIAQATPGLKPVDLAPIHTLHARALLNHGQAADGYAELKAALKAQGGLTQHVTLDDVVTRSDLALAAMLNHDERRAHEYLAYTGAGRFGDSPFASATSMDLPPCGGRAGLEPADYAVVEFSVRDDGHVMRVSPIYASRSGAVAAEFASAVASWSWRPEDVQKIPAFFRLVTRVEMRCSTASAHPDLLAQLQPTPEEWMASHLPGAGAFKASGTEAQRHQWLLEARDLMARNGAALATTIRLEIEFSEADARARSRYGQHRDYLRKLLARPDVAAEPRVAALLRLLVAEPHYGSPAPGDAAALLKATADDPALAADDPLKVGALVRLASLQAAAGDLAAARASFDLTGLSDRQCSLVDANPAARRFGDPSFPQEALGWGFEGWVIVQFDIRADGQTTNQRAVVAYPPLVFQEAALEAARGSRYEQTYRPAGGLGCGGKQMKVTFQQRP